MQQFNPDKFLRAQNKPAMGYATALMEIKQGEKDTHWIWYIFPQLVRLDLSEASFYYALQNLDEARQYLEHPVLGTRLREISQALLAHKNKSIKSILGPIDAKKVKACMTLFDIVEPNSVFEQVLNTFYKGEVDVYTAVKATSQLSPRKVFTFYGKERS